ncbi:MAG: hypothetical protein KAZ88_10640 [Acidimicrobiia bacterium]|nr:hypothetical protein [Acidimicrobiia bacterium]MBP8181437.1 hypothetical protein [Acidimicrobiia bacterium]
MRILFIANSTAASYSSRVRIVVTKSLSADHEVEYVTTERKGHATRLARDAALRGFDVVVVMAGDGTLNEAANGLVGTSTALATLPGGSTNVFARSIGVEPDPIEAVGQLIEALANDQIYPISLGCVNGRYFLFHTGLGMDAAVTHRVDAKPHFKRLAAHPFFATQAVVTWFKDVDSRNPWFRVQCSDGTVVEDGMQAIVMNQQPYTYMGSAPLVAVDGIKLDGPMSVIVSRSLGVTHLIRLFQSAATNRRYLEKSKKIVIARDVESVVIDGHRPVSYQVDGDYLGAVDHLDIHRVPNAIRVVLPNKT